MSAPPTEVKPCGTIAAYQRHRKAGETPCADCRRAWREYHRDYRERVGTEGARAYSAARNAAISRLIALHPGQFQALLDEERDR